MDKTRWLIALIATMLVAGAIGATMQYEIYLPVIRVDPTLTPTITPSPTVTPTPTMTATPDSGLQITDIHNGNSTDDEQDEYIKIKNYGSSSVNMTDWFIRSENPIFYYFPDNFTLAASATVTIWTKSGTNTSSNLYWNRTDPVWDNHGDCGYLRDDSDGDNILVDQYCY
jgi:hypothetical protein